MNKSVLVVVSPLNISDLFGEAAIKLAQSLKAAGATRADLGEDPFIRHTLDTLESTPEARRGLRGYNTLAGFPMFARATVDSLFRPILGKSDVQFLSQGIDRRMLELYARVAGKLEQDNPLSPPRTYMGKSNDLGFAFYLAHKAMSPEGYPYDHAVFIGMSRLEKSVLMRLDPARDAIRLGHGATAIDLKGLRRVISDLYRGPHNTYNN